MYTHEIHTSMARQPWLEAIQIYCCYLEERTLHEHCRKKHQSYQGSFPGELHGF